jgi:uncharacterized protein (TIGR03083 family)
VISLSFDRCLAVLEQSAGGLVDTVERAGLDARCATCAWDGRALLAHQAMVHRWATAHITGGDAAAVPTQTALIETEADLAGYYREGAASLLAALAAAPADLEAMTFLNDVASPRQFWARRQTHETTIHMVDAVSAAVGRVPTAAEVAIDGDIAVDGIDELLCGFFTRGRSKLFDGTELDVLVAPDDSDRRWLVHVAEKLTVAPEGSAPVTVRGSAVEIYLALWNRSELRVTGDEVLAQRWRTSQRVRWS